MQELIAYIKAENVKTQAWIDEDPENRCAGLMLEDVGYWNDMGIATVAEYELYEMRNNIWDLYKDVHGFRPRGINFDEMSNEELAKMYDDLLVELEEVTVNEAAMQRTAISHFEDTVTQMIGSGANDRSTAIRWLMDAEDDRAGEGYFEYCNNLPYGYLEQAAA